MRDAPGKIGRAVDRVDIDRRCSLLCIPVGHSFFALDCIVGEGSAQFIDNDPLDRHIDLGLVIPRRLCEQLAVHATTKGRARLGSPEKNGVSHRREARGGGFRNTG